MINDKKIALCVDLDGTLLKSDILYESILLLVKKRPWLLFLLPFWVMKGKVFLKKKMYDIISIDPCYMPYNQDVIEFIKKEKSHRTEVALATATWKPVAESIAKHLGLFDRVIGTEDNVNLRGENKLLELEKIYGKGQFDYMGDSSVDIPIWKSSNRAYLVNPDSSTEERAIKIGNVERIFQSDQSNFINFIKEIRVYQWVKNLLLFLPMFMAHSISINNIFTNILAFFSFSFAASAVYVLNDMMDLESDRQHPNKRNRPFAAGNLSVKMGLFIIPSFLLISLGSSFALMKLEFSLILLAYLLLTSAYSFILKKIYVFDILLLASLYTLRLYAGGLSIDVPISTWLVAFSMFIFLSLGIVKRFTELYYLSKSNKEKTSGRGYDINDMEMLRSAGIASGFISVLVFALYVNDIPNTNADNLYSDYKLLYFITPFLLYWIMRIWIKASRGEMTDDPIVFAGRDPVGYVLVIIIGFIVLGASI